MTDKIRALFEKHRDTLAYVFFGVITTVVNWGVFFFCDKVLALSETLSETIAWFLSLLAAFLTNKPFVFHSYNWSCKTICPEFIKFFGTRAGSGVLDIALMYLLITCCGLGEYTYPIKLLISVIVIIINYIGSKLLVFRNK